MNLHSSVILACLAALAASARAQSPAPAAAPAVPPAASASQAPAAPMSPDTVLADNGIARVTRADYDLELTKLPADIRGGFATTDRRVVDLITKILVTKTLAAQADSSGLLKDPHEAARFAAEIERYKSQIVVQQIVLAKAKSFDANLPAWEARAKDVYATDPARWAQPEQVLVAHLLYRPEKRGGAEGAMKAARDARAQLVAGADFGKLAREADDPQASRTSGQIGYIARGTMDPDFEKAAFALGKGELSEPVVTQFGVHLILVSDRLPERKRSFDEVKGEILVELKQKYVNAERDAELAGMQEKARESANMALVETMVIRMPSSADLDRLHREATRVPGARPRN